MTQQRYARSHFYSAPQRFTLHASLTMFYIGVLDRHVDITTGGLSTVARLCNAICGLSGGFGAGLYDRQLRYANYAVMVRNGNPVHAVCFWFTEDWPSLRL